MFAAFTGQQDLQQCLRCMDMLPSAVAFILTVCSCCVLPAVKCCVLFVLCAAKSQPVLDKTVRSWQEQFTDIAFLNVDARTEQDPHPRAFCKPCAAAAKVAGKEPTAWTDSSKGATVYHRSNITAHLQSKQHGDRSGQQQTSGVHSLRLVGCRRLPPSASLTS